MASEHLLVEAALLQHGLVTTAQAREHGFGTEAIRFRVQQGRWRRIRRGVLAIGACAHTWEQQVMAACLAAGPDAVASHRTAARLRSIVDRSGRIELTVPSDRSVALSGTTVHRSLLLPSVDLAAVGSIPTTTVARTIVDASAHQSVATVGRWTDDAIRAGTLDLRELRSCVARLAGPGRHHLAPVRAVLASRMPGYDPGDSELEVRALAALADAGLPLPVQQHPVILADGQICRLDLAYPDALVAIELDGWAFHGDRTAFHRDRDRRNALTLLGWRVLQFTARTPAEELVAMVSQALGLTHEF